MIALTCTRITFCVLYGQASLFFFIFCRNKISPILQFLVYSVYNFPMMRNASIAIIFNSTRDKIVLVKRRDVPIWVLPGGGIDPGETPEEALLREVKEETGVVAIITRKVAIYTPNGRLSRETHLFACEVKSGELSLTNETQAVDFFSLTELPKLFFPIHGLWLNDCLDEHPHTIIKPIEGISYWNIIKWILFHPIYAARFFLTKLGIYINS